MRVLLDTHVYLWFVQDEAKLRRPAFQLIQNADEVFVSSATIWEIAIKGALGKIQADVPALVQKLQRNGFKELPVQMAHAVQVRTLPLFHRDPFDRMLVAQAMVGQLRLLTADRRLRRYSPLVIDA
ncbi:type II toxin-antitoxin system VapC family toxin [Massilia cavernae]|uniref:Type II toxin-antitoxin system VapC family toxin n=1 Tax=Massilia cavernae TaxID=2320864 RepID=A0A418XT65_9BURK|nr:type II toxin-antitoxin system VapC family toxin [Massilia cavernae]RJG15778.1 type II toxin-antitoxin system VapC family toxin [Massilia cavernae]